MKRLFILPLCFIGIAGCSSPEAEAPTQISENPAIAPTAVSVAPTLQPTPQVAPTIVPTPTTSPEAPPTAAEMGYMNHYQNIQTSIEPIRDADIFSNPSDLAASKSTVEAARSLNATFFPIPDRFALTQQYLTQALDKHSQLLSTLTTHQSLGTTYPDGKLELLATQRLYDSAKAEFRRVFKLMNTVSPPR